MYTRNHDLRLLRDKVGVCSVCSSNSKYCFVMHLKGVCDISLVFFPLFKFLVLPKLGDFLLVIST